MWGALFILLMTFYYTVLLPILVANEKEKRVPLPRLEPQSTAIVVSSDVYNRKIA